MEAYFKKFRENIIGYNQKFQTPYGEQTMIYADWVASGRLYAPIEKKIAEEIGPFVGNTHTETSETGTLMTHAYKYAKTIIKKHVNASEDDVLITAGFGMTAAINKLQRILGFKGCGKLQHKECIYTKDTPLVLVSHMEHHSNQTSWYETVADVEIVDRGPDGLFSVENLKKVLEKHKDRKQIIGSFTACSNVSGIETDYHAFARVMHEYGGLCFVDFAANAPYSDINMHPSDPKAALDAIFFSPHKFLGGPGSSGVLIFNRSLYHNLSPDQPGGGTVDWTNAWGEYKFIDDIEGREDGGTPGFLQAMRAALAIKLKEQMGTANIHKREDELVAKVFKGLADVPGLFVFEPQIKKRTGAISLHFNDIHYNLVVKLLNDRYGIQVRGGCACAGTYGHILYGINKEESHRITNNIDQGNLSEKPGFVRLSVHPTMTNAELDIIIKAFHEIAIHHKEWEKDYVYNEKNNEFFHKSYLQKRRYEVDAWFEL